MAMVSLLAQATTCGQPPLLKCFLVPSPNPRILRFLEVSRSLTCPPVFFGWEKMRSWQLLLGFESTPPFGKAFRNPLALPLSIFEDRGDLQIAVIIGKLGNSNLVSDGDQS
jgi:hypothetical protein